MRKAVIFCTLPVFFLTACNLFKTQTAAPAKEPVLGIVKLQDIRGAAQEKTFFAQFAQKSSAKGLLALGTFLKPQTEIEGPTCSVKKETVNISSANNLKIVSVGELSLASKVKTIPIPETEGLTYTAKGLVDSLSEGDYEVSATGSDTVAPFTEAFSMPEDLSDVKGNALKFEDGVLIKKGQGLKLEWHTPVRSADDNFLVAQLITAVKTGNKADMFFLSCVGQEPYFSNSDSNHLMWEIPASQIDVLPFGNPANVYFSRVHAIKGKKMSGELHGYRSYVGAAGLVP